MSVVCPFCDRSFTSSHGIFGQDATLLRDAHVPACEANPRNKCFCGVIFPNAAAKEKHAVTCEFNPANRFTCTFCSQVFVTSFGIMGRVSTDGKCLRDAHAISCKDNPANTCFCGNLFPNPEARNAHAVTCDANPANRYSCQFCQAQFVKTFNMFGFCSKNGRAERDAHQLCCEKNPKNICFCGAIFPNPTARDRHAATCQQNPVNRFQCSFCARLFITRFGVMGRVSCDGKVLRDTHEVGCEKNPANVCFCGQLFMSPAARDAHAAKCAMNPANRFSCQYCRKTFVTTFGIFSSNGGAERDAHLPLCSKNPANATCVHCTRTFVDTKGSLKWLYTEAHRRCENHMNCCAQNPKNRFRCDRCGKCFVSGRDWLRKADGKLLRDLHRKECDFIPCEYVVKDSEIGDWLLMSAGTECAPADLDDEEDDGPDHHSRTRSSDDLDTNAASEPEIMQSSSLISSENPDVSTAVGSEKMQDSADSSILCSGEPSLPSEQVRDTIDTASACFHDAKSSNGDVSDSGSDVLEEDEEEYKEDASEETDRDSIGDDFSDVEMAASLVLPVADPE